VKRRALERHLRAHGAQPIQEGAAHTKWRGPAGARSVVPRHNEIGVQIVIAICKQLGVPRPSNPRPPHASRGAF
jgi:predicted RNA binding protein YcfA (HicA-like mRNA interferase family)